MSGDDNAAPDTGAPVKSMATIQNRRGLHARAAAMFVKTAGAFEADITVSKGGQSVSGLSIMGLMMLAAGPGTEIELSATGTQAEEAVQALCQMIDARFQEE